MICSDLRSSAVFRQTLFITCVKFLQDVVAYTINFFKRLAFQGVIQKIQRDARGGVFFETHCSVTARTLQQYGLNSAWRDETSGGV